MDVKIALRKDKKNKFNEFPMVIQLSDKKQLARISLGINVRIEDFDEKIQKVKRSCKQATEFNERLAAAKELIEVVNHHFNEIKLINKNPIRPDSDLQIFKRLYESISKGREENNSYGIPDHISDSDIEILKEALVYEFGTRTNKQAAVRLPRKITPENVIKIKKLTRAIVNNQSDEEVEDWVKKGLTATPTNNEHKFYQKKVQEYLEHSKNEKKESTHSRIDGHFKTLNAFAKSKGIVLTFESFDEQFGLDFKYYLEKNHKNKALKRTGVSSGTVHNIQKNICAFLNWAHKKDYHQNLRFKRWSTKKPKTDLQYLTEDQMVKLRNFDLPENSSYSTSRDLWLFMAYTGMRVSDMENWKKSNVNGRFIKFISQKANKTCVVPLNSVSESLLKKYDYELPRQASSKINKNIKEILKDAGIDNPINRTLKYGKKNETKELPLCDAITIHSARRSFINLMICKGVEVFQLSSMTGNTVQNLMVYYKTNENQLVESMSKIEYK